MVPELATSSGWMNFINISFISKHIILDPFSEGKIIAQRD